MPKTIIHLLSGGLDSVTMLYDLKAQGHAVHCVMFDYGQAHLRELKCATQHCALQGVNMSSIRLPELGGLTDESWIVPNRNAIFLSAAVNLAIRAKSDTVTIGCNQDDAESFPDCRKPFLEAMNSAVRAAGYSVEICAPYLDWPKWKIGGLAREMGVPLGSIGIWSCYRGGDKPCGECPACKKLEAALK